MPKSYYYLAGRTTSPAFRIAGAASGDAETEQRAGGLRLPGRPGQHRGVDDHLLEVGWNRADERNARHVNELADLLKADFRLAARDDGSHRLAGRRTAHLSGLASDLVGDA